MFGGTHLDTHGGTDECGIYTTVADHDVYGVYGRARQCLTIPGHSPHGLLDQL